MEQWWNDGQKRETEELSSGQNAELFNVKIGVKYSYH
jgi:hypothetical protein